MNTNKNFKKLYCIILAAVTVLVSVGAYFGGRKHSLNTRAMSVLRSEISSLTNEYNAKKSQNEASQKQKKDLQKQISEKSHINKEIAQSVSELEDVKKSTEDTKNQISEKKSLVEEQEKRLSEIKQITAAAKGKRLSLREGVYRCPEEIAEGRYTVSGSYTIVLYDSSGKAKMSENLSKLDGSTFTFDIKDGEKIRAASD